MSESSKHLRSQSGSQKNDLFLSIVKSIAYTSWVSVAFFAAAALTFLLTKLIDAVGLPYQSLPVHVQQAMFAALTYVFAIVAAVGIPYIAKFSTKRKEIGLQRIIYWSDIAIGVAGFVPYIAISIILTILATSLIPGFDIDQVQNVGFQGVLSRESLVLAFLTLVVIAPIAEETLFRGYLYGKIKQQLGTFGAIALSSVCFALIHFQANVAVDVFALAIILGILRELTGSIWAGIVLHMVKNGIAYYFLFIAPYML